MSLSYVFNTLIEYISNIAIKLTIYYAVYLVNNRLGFILLGLNIINFISRVLLELEVKQRYNEIVNKEKKDD